MYPKILVEITCEVKPSAKMVNFNGDTITAQEWVKLPLYKRQEYCLRDHENIIFDPSHENFYENLIVLEE